MSHRKIFLSLSRLETREFSTQQVVSRRKQKKKIKETWKKNNVRKNWYEKLGEKYPLRKYNEQVYYSDFNTFPFAF